MSGVRGRRCRRRPGAGICGQDRRRAAAAEASMLSRAVFLTSRRIFDVFVKHAETWEDSDRIMARYAPVTLVLLPGVWVACILLAFIPMYWAVGVEFPRERADDQRVIAPHARVRVQDGPARRRAVVRRSDDRVGSRGPPDLVPPDDLRPLLATRGARRPARRARRHATATGRAAAPGEHDRVAGPAG